MNKLYFGDNLDILREHIKDESVDLTITPTLSPFWQCGRIAKLTII